MGWASGTYVAEDLWKELSPLVEDKEGLAVGITKALTKHHWDTVDEVEEFHKYIYCTEDGDYERRSTSEELKMMYATYMTRVKDRKCDYLSIDYFDSFGAFKDVDLFWDNIHEMNKDILIKFKEAE